MKFNKLFFAAVAFATLAMVSCKKDEPTPVIPTPEDEEVAPEMPQIAAPAAGKTTIAIYAEVCPRGAYLVGSFQGYNPSDDSFSFEKVEGTEHWYAVTIDYAADLQAKAIARPSDTDVALAWDYQWGKNHDPNDANCEVEEGKDNTVILGGTGDWVFENGGQPKISAVADGGVVYIWVKKWAASPVIEAKKLETCWCKSNLNGKDWAWYEMTPKGDGLFELAARWGGSGLNINSEGKDDGAAWYPDPEKVGDVEAGDSVLISFQSEKMAIGKLTLTLIEKGTPATAVPAGHGIFTIKILNREYAAGDKCIFTGSFEEKAWGDSDREMTYDEAAKTWSWEGDFPENFEYKVIYNGQWATGNNVKFDGETFGHEFEIQD